MQDGRFDLDVVQFELDQARRQRDAELAAAERTPPLKAPVAAWAPVLIWLTTTVTILILQT